MKSSVACSDVDVRKTSAVDGHVAISNSLPQPRKKLKSKKPKSKNPKSKTTPSSGSESNRGRTVAGADQARHFPIECGYWDTGREGGKRTAASRPTSPACGGGRIASEDAIRVGELSPHEQCQLRRHPHPNPPPQAGEGAKVISLYLPSSAEVKNLVPSKKRFGRLNTARNVAPLGACATWMLPPGRHTKSPAPQLPSASSSDPSSM